MRTDRSGEVCMCRWLAYVGDPVEPREFLYDPERSLIAQSRSHAPGMGVPNGDGTGLGWYGRREVPALFRSTTPAWANETLRELAHEVETGLFLAHVRAGTGTPVQTTNCHPFRHGRWLFVHNGYVAEYMRLRRTLMMAVRPDLFPELLGTTDSELMFFLALTFGLEADPIDGLQRMAGFVESVGRAAGVAEPLQMTVAVSDGERVYAARYASGPVANSLFVSEDVQSLRLLHPEAERLSHYSDDARLVVSEPLVALPGAWREVPPGSALVVDGVDVHEVPFTPEPT
jgi:predicted glutamine amidotransferase